MSLRGSGASHDRSNLLALESIPPNRRLLPFRTAASQRAQSQRKLAATCQLLFYKRKLQIYCLVINSPSDEHITY